jgi:hypothetical protein
VGNLLILQYKNTAEAAVDAMRIILKQCERSKTVKRVIHTASVTAASPLREDGGEGYKDFINESCWTPLGQSHPYSSDMSAINQVINQQKKRLFLNNFFKKTTRYIL